MKNGIRIGMVSSIDYDTGMVRVYYPDRDETTAELPYFCFMGEYQMPQVDDMVLVLHLSNDGTSGVVLGKYWCDNELPRFTGERVYYKDLSPAAFISCIDGEYLIHADSIRFECNAGSVTMADLIRKLESSDE